MNENAKYLYFEPVVYMPYKISLRNNNAIILTHMWIENGEEINLVKQKPKPKREANKNYIRMEFDTPLYMDVAPLNGVDEVVTFVMKYLIDFGDGNSTKLVHRQHIAIRRKNVVPSNSIGHYTTRHATPAIFGLVGKDYISDMVNLDESREVIQFGMLEEDMKAWYIETIDMLYPNSVLQHGTVH